LQINPYKLNGPRPKEKKMKSTTPSRHHMLFSLAILLCMTAAASWTFAQATDDGGDRPQRQRQFQGEGRGPRQGQGDGEGRQGKQGGPFGDVLKALNLTEEQQTQVREIMQKHHDQVEAFREKNGESFKKIRGQMRDAMEEKDYDKLHSLVDQLKTVEADRPTIKELAAEIRNVLTDEQKATFDAKTEEMKNNRGKHMRRGPGNDGEGNAEGGRQFRRGEGGPRRGGQGPETEAE
jgi:Spy/CpxP family protein refolding chaperone